MSDNDEYLVAADLLEEQGYQAAAKKLRRLARPQLMPCLIAALEDRSIQAITFRMDHAPISDQKLVISCEHLSSLQERTHSSKRSLNKTELLEYSDPDYVVWSLLRDAICEDVPSFSSGDNRSKLQKMNP